MKALVIGSGFLGVTTAYFLRRGGHDVTVIDRENEPAPAKSASFANASILTPSMADPWNAPGVWRALLGSLGQPNAPVLLRLHALPSLVGWGTAFLRNSHPVIYERNTLINLRLALHSLEVMRSLRQQTAIDYGFAARGTLRIFRAGVSLNRAQDAANRLGAEGLRFRRLNRADTIALEPALEPIAPQLAGALHYGDDESGDAREFCVALAHHAQQLGVHFRFGIEVKRFEMRSGRIAALSGGGRLVGDTYVVAAGSYSGPLVRSAGVDLPVRPVKGYSVTVDGHLGAPAVVLALRIPIVDYYWHAALVPLSCLDDFGEPFG